MAGILIFKCTEGAGVGDYSSRRRGREGVRLEVSQYLFTFVPVSFMSRFGRDLNPIRDG